MYIDETVETFRNGAMQIDSSTMVLKQHKEDGEIYVGSGYQGPFADHGTDNFPQKTYPLT